MNEHLRNLIYEQAVEAGFGVEAKGWPFGYTDVQNVAASLADPSHGDDDSRRLFVRVAMERLAWLAGVDVVPNQKRELTR